VANFLYDRCGLKNKFLADWTLLTSWICTQATWIEVGTFIALNYIIHAFTIVQDPGADLLSKVGTVLLCLFLPLFGSVTVIPIIRRRFMRIFRLRRLKTLLTIRKPDEESDDSQRQQLLTAAHAGALRIIIGFRKEKEECVANSPSFLADEKLLMEQMY
jgi:hypothetical protein